MARVPYLSKSDVSTEHHDLLDRDANIYKALINSPHALRSFRGLGGFIRFKSKLDPRLRELAILQVGYLTRSRYEYSHHIKIGRDFGVSDDDIRAIAAETSGKATSLEPLGRAVLRAAREMTVDLAVSDATFAELKKSFDNECLTDLVVTIGFYNAVVRILATMQVDVEKDYLHFLDEFPFPKD